MLLYCIRGTATSRSLVLPGLSTDLALQFAPRLLLCRGLLFRRETRRNLYSPDASQSVGLQHSSATAAVYSWKGILSLSLIRNERKSSSEMNRTKMRVQVKGVIKACRRSYRSPHQVARAAGSMMHTWCTGRYSSRNGIRLFKEKSRLSAINRSFIEL